MRRIIAVVMVVSIFFMMTVSAKAAEQERSIAVPNLKFNGATATCSLEVSANNTSDPIIASVTLKHGNTVVKQWLNMTASGYMNFSDTAHVVQGNTYTMQVLLYINGVLYPISDITKTCN